MKYISKIIDILKIIATQPLSFLRFSLSLFMGRSLISDLNVMYSFPNNTHYDLSKTWFINFLPDSLLTFTPEHYVFIKVFIIITVVGSALGILGRLNLILLAFLSFYLMGTREGFGIFYHNSSLPAQVIFILALVPGSMKLSIDYFLYKIFNKKRKELSFFSENPKWGVNLILILLMATYLTAGISKLRYGNGLNWFDGNTLSMYLKERTILQEKGNVQLIIGKKNITEEEKWKDKFGFIGHTYGNYRITNKFDAINNFIADNKLVVIFLAIGSVLFEICGFIMFINSKYRNIYLISAILFHTSLGMLMGLYFTRYRLICFLLLDWVSIFSYIDNKLKNKLKFKFI